MYFTIISIVFAATDRRKELSLHYYRGTVNFEAGRYENALTEFQSASAIDPYYKDTSRYIENCIKVLEKNRQDIINVPEGGLEDKRGFDLYFLGKSYYEKGDYRRAKEVFKAVLSTNPNDKFALYYEKLCNDILSGTQEAKKSRMSPEEDTAVKINDLEKEVSYIKSDIKDQQGMEALLETKAQRKASRDELIRQKEKQLKEQEELLGEEREDYIAQAKITERTNKVRKETEKWKIMKEKLASNQPGVPADLSEFPIYLNKAESYYVVMKESLRTSRWNSAGLNAINASLYYCDALLIYFYEIKSASPKHENITRLILSNIKRSDVDESVFHLHSILNIKKIVEGDDRPITRSEAIFLSEHTDKVVEWCKSIFP